MLDNPVHSGVGRLTESRSIDSENVRTIVDLCRAQAVKMGDAPFARFEATGRSLSFVEFDAHTSAAADAFRRRDLGFEKNIAVHLPNCEEFLVAWWGLAKAGATVVPTNLELTSAELDYQVRGVNAAGAITTPEHRTVFERAGVPNIVVVGGSGDTSWDAFMATGRADELARDDPVPEAVAQILFTSGSTSRPKGAMITHAQMVFAAGEWISNYGLHEGERFLVNLPMYHLTGQTPCLAAMALGGSVVVVPRFSATQWLDQIRSNHVTMTTLVGTTLRMVLAQPETVDDGDNDLRQIVYAINVPRAEWERFERRFNAPLINGYGMTEAFGSVVIAPTTGDRHVPSIGRASPIREVQVHDANGQQVAPGEIGEIVIAGAPGSTMFLGYYNEPDATAEAWRGGWYHSGDFGYVDDDGFFFFVDRRTDMIKTSGENVSASEVEDVLRQHPNVVEAAVVGVSDAIRDQAVKAYIIQTRDEELTADEIKQFCGERLASFKVPAIVEFRVALPTNEAGKVMRKHLRDEQASVEFAGVRPTSRGRSR